MYSAIERQQLLAVARESIQNGLTYGTLLELDLWQFSYALRSPGASFVTLRIDNLLRGCIGNIVPRESLIESVARNAFNAAFHDPRFGPLSAEEFSLLKIEVSVLSELEPLRCESEADLRRKLRPGRDGLVITAGERNATFLPTVWGQLPEPQHFVAHLKEKAGLEPDEWPENILAERYTTYTVAG